MISEGFAYEPDQLHALLVAALSPQLAKWHAKRKQALLASITQALTPPPEAPPKHHWISYNFGGQLVKTLARQGVYAVHVRGRPGHWTYVVDHVPTGGLIQERARLRDAREVMLTLAEEFPDFMGTWRKLPTPPREMSILIKRLREQHGLM